MNSTSPAFPWRHVLAFLASAVVLLAGLGRVFDFASRHDLRSKARWIISQHDGAYDFAVLGSSRAYVGVNVSQLQHELGCRGVNLALDGAGYPEQLLALRLFTRANHVQNLLLDLQPATIDAAGFTYPFHDYEYLAYDCDPVIDSALRDEFGLKAAVWKYVPFWRNAEFNSKIGPVQLYTWIKTSFDPRARIPEFDSTGSHPVDRAFHTRADARPIRWHTAPRLCSALQKIIDFASSQGIRVSLTMTPEWQTWSRLQENRDEIIDYFRQIAASNHLLLLNFDDLPFRADTAFFLDQDHLNAKGSALYTHELAVRLKALWKVPGNTPSALQN